MVNKRIKRKDNKKEIPETKIREVKKLEKIKFRDRIKLKRRPEISFLVTMLFSNGTIKHFVVTTKEEIFTYKKRTYYLKYTDAWFDLSHNQYRLFFFDDYPVPIDREIVKKGGEHWFSVTPQNLKPLVKMEYVKALANAHELSKFLKFTLLLMIVNTLILVAVAIFTYQIYNA